MPVPPANLHLSLRKITEILAAELAAPTGRAPAWVEFEWNLARAVAAIHGVSPLLSNRLPWQGPADWVRFLSGQKAHTVVRHRGIQALLSKIDEGALEAVFPVMALKGAALHTRGLYSIGERPMADVDLLVRPADAAAASALLEAMGFHRSIETWKETVFAPAEQRVIGTFGEHGGNSVKIELHTRICEKLPLRVTDVTPRVFPADAPPGLIDYPRNASLMIHLLLHAAASMAFQGLRLLQLHDIALLCGRMSGADWSEVLEPGPGGTRPWWAYPPLKLMSRYYRSAAPPGVLDELARHCGYYLRKVASRRILYDVSYSYPWVKALPGVEWSQSLTEALSYALTRARPGSGQVALREYTAATQAWAQGSKWAQASQSLRILRWLSSRQTRPVTMHAVNAVFEQSPLSGSG